MNEENTNATSDIKRMSIADLLDGRSFYVPDYQRGYRWTDDQVEELLKDLLLFSLAEKNKDSYYCLQPIVVRWDDSRKWWELIDGQQRLTTIKILLRWLQQDLGEKKWNALKGVTPYVMHYETRDKVPGETNRFIEGLASGETASGKEPIDYYYMRKAWEKIDIWFGDTEHGAPALCELLKEDPTMASDFIRGILTRKPEGKNPTVQVLWYEACREESGTAIFTRLNSNKLGLTDAELVKGLFTMCSNNRGDSTEQFRKSMKWELMENALHDDAFWFFITDRKDKEPPNRIDKLLELIFRDVYVPSPPKQGEPPEDVESALRRKHAIFNRYNNRFIAVDNSDAIKEEWKRIEYVFRVLKNWFSDPQIYNLVGYLCHTGTKNLRDLYVEFCKLKKTHGTREAFIDQLKGYIRESLKDVVPVKRWTEKRQGNHGEEIEIDRVSIDLEFDKNHDLIYNLLVLLNVDHLNKRLQTLHSSTDFDKLVVDVRSTCKFPFAVLKAEQWDIEHVDSQTDNPLTDAEEATEWIILSFEALEQALSRDQLADISRHWESAEAADERKQIILNMTNDERQEIIRSIRFCVEEHKDDGRKHNISNLVLLDAHTNRKYKNAIFIRKRREIINCRENGQFVPETTSYVFFKLLEGSASTRWVWTSDDRNRYSNYIVTQLEDYLIIPLATDETKVQP